MTLGATAFVQGSTTHTARVVRNGSLGASLWTPWQSFAGGVEPTLGGGAHGVLGMSDFAVTVSSGLTLNVAAGRAVITGTTAAAQGPYGVYNDATVTTALNAHNTQPRIDLVWVRIQDQDEDGSGVEAPSIGNTAGTPSGSPVAPSPPSGALVLATVAVPATSGAVTITDRRTFAAAIGGTVRCKSTTRPTGVALYEGMVIYETDTNRELINTSSTTTATWEILSESPQAWTLGNMTQSVAVSTTTTSGRYQRTRGGFWASMEATITSSGTAGQVIRAVTPFTVQHAFGAYTYFDNGNTNWGGTAIAFGNEITFGGDGNNQSLGLGTQNFGMASGDIIRFHVTGYY